MNTNDAPNMFNKSYYSISISRTFDGNRTLRAIRQSDNASLQYPPPQSGTLSLIILTTATALKLKLISIYNKCTLRKERHIMSEGKVMSSFPWISNTVNNDRSHKVPPPESELSLLLYINKIFFRNTLQSE